MQVQFLVLYQSAGENPSNLSVCPMQEETLFDPTDHVHSEEKIIRHGVKGQKQT